MAESFVLNTGASIPSIGLGTWQLEPDVVGNAIYAAVKVFSGFSSSILIPFSWFL
jgi:diketogulonate reductase-like aldo/keto reductase